MRYRCPPPRASRSLTSWPITSCGLIVAALLSLGCLIPMTGLEVEDWDEPTPDGPRTDTRDGETPVVTQSPSDPRRVYDPLSHERRDDPRSPEYRGMFSLQLEGDTSLTLDSARLGEATYSYITQDATGGPAHCLIALMDRRPDDSGAQGYLLLRYVAPSCALEVGELPVLARDQDGQEPRLILGALRLEREQADLFREWELDDPEGVLTVTSHQGGRLQAELKLTLSRQSEDGEPWRRARTLASGFMDAVWMPVVPGSPAPR